MRLIDADALAARYMGTPPDYYHTTQIVGEITAAPTVKLTGWTSVKDRVPEIGKLCLVYDGKQITVGRHVRSGMWITPGMSRDVTHWMPLPETPEED